MSDVNIPNGGQLRLVILEQSLDLEEHLSSVIKALIQVKKNDSKILGYKGSALSLQTKVDLLYDIEWLDKSLYDDLNLFIEIRNKFIHVRQADTFKKVFELIPDRRKKFLDLDYQKIFTIAHYDMDKIWQYQEARKSVLENKVAELPDGMEANVYYLQFMALRLRISDALEAIYKKISEHTDRIMKLNALPDTDRYYREQSQFLIKVISEFPSFFESKYKITGAEKSLTDEVSDYVSKRMDEFEAQFKAENN